MAAGRRYGQAEGGRRALLTHIGNLEPRGTKMEQAFGVRVCIYLTTSASIYIKVIFRDQSAAPSRFDGGWGGGVGTFTSPGPPRPEATGHPGKVTLSTLVFSLTCRHEPVPHCLDVVPLPARLTIHPSFKATAPPTPPSRVSVTITTSRFPVHYLLTRTSKENASCLFPRLSGAS